MFHQVEWVLTLSPHVSPGGVSAHSCHLMFHQVEWVLTLSPIVSPGGVSAHSCHLMFHQVEWVLILSPNVSPGGARAHSGFVKSRHVLCVWLSGACGCCPRLGWLWWWCQPPGRSGQTHPPGWEWLCRPPPPAPLAPTLVPAWPGSRPVEGVRQWPVCWRLRCGKEAGACWSLLRGWTSSSRPRHSQELRQEETRYLQQSELSNIRQTGNLLCMSA